MSVCGNPTFTNKPMLGRAESCSEAAVRVTPSTHSPHAEQILQAVGMPIDLVASPAAASSARDSVQGIEGTLAI